MTECIVVAGYQRFEGHCYPVDGGSVPLKNVGIHLPDYTESIQKTTISNSNAYPTDHGGWGGNARTPGSNIGRGVYAEWGCSCLLHWVQENVEIVPCNRPQKLPSTYFPFHYGVIILTLDTAHSGATESDVKGTTKRYEHPVYFPNQHWPVGLCSGDVMCKLTKVRLLYERGYVTPWAGTLKGEKSFVSTSEFPTDVWIPEVLRK
jgi:hypothetical protein